MKKITAINFMLSDDEFTPTTVSSVDIPGGATPPDNRLICWYGTRDSLAALKEKRLYAKKKNKALFRVELVIDGGDVPPGKIGVDDLTGLYFMNLERVKVDLRDYMTEIILTSEKILKSDEDYYKDSIELIAEKPSRLDFLWNQDDFKHLTGIVWPAPIPGAVRKFDVRQLMAVDISAPHEVIVRNFQGDVSQINFIV